MSIPEPSEIYEEAVELRELLNKIPGWKIRMSAQFLACIITGNRKLVPQQGDERFLREDISCLSTVDRVRVFKLVRSLHEKGKYEFSSTPERYALRAFIMSVILGQEYTYADVGTLIDGLREVAAE